jgi:lipoate-protein ligase B
MRTPSAASGTPLEFRRLGLVPYGEALALQQRLQAERIDGRIPDTVLLLEHPDTITFGRGGDPRFALASEAELVARGYEVHRTNRGGEVTWHGPGQLVGYPIVDLAPRGGDVHRYLRQLERALVAALADFGVAARARDGYTGVWIDERTKIASIGIGVRRGVTLHGFALNVCCALERWSAIVPCGLAGVTMTSVEAQAGAVDFRAVEAAVERALAKELA